MQSRGSGVRKYFITSTWQTILATFTSTRYRACATLLYTFGPIVGVKVPSPPWSPYVTALDSGWFVFCNDNIPAVGMGVDLWLKTHSKDQSQLSSGVDKGDEDEDGEDE